MIRPGAYLEICVLLVCMVNSKANLDTNSRLSFGTNLKMNELIQQFRDQEGTFLRMELEEQSRAKLSQAAIRQLEKPLKERVWNVLWNPLWGQFVRQSEVSIRNQIYHQLKNELTLE